MHLTICKYQKKVYDGVRTEDIFYLFGRLVLGFGSFLMVFWLFCFLCLPSSMRFTASCTKDERKKSNHWITYFSGFLYCYVEDLWHNQDYCQQSSGVWRGKTSYFVLLLSFLLPSLWIFFFYKTVKCQARNNVQPDIEPLWWDKKAKTKYNICFSVIKSL